MWALCQADRHEAASNTRSYVTQGFCPVAGHTACCFMWLICTASAAQEISRYRSMQEHMCCSIKVTLPSYVLPRVVRMTSGAR